MALHSCAECGLSHDGITEERESEAYRLAKLESETRIELARIERSTARQETAAMIDIAEVQADAMVDAAEVHAEVVGAAIEGSDQEPPEPLEIVAPEFVNNDVDVVEDAPPEPEGSPVPVPEKTTSFGAW